MIHAVVLAAALSGPTLIAQTQRCSGMVTEQLETQVRKYDSNPPSPDKAAARIGDLGEIIQGVNEEANILNSVCPADDLPPRLQQLQAVSAWAYALESDASQKEFASCPDQKNAIAAGFLAPAWLELGRASSPDLPKPPALVTKMIAAVQTRAAAVAFTLPTLADASDYWTKQTQEAGKQAVLACASK